MGSPFYFRHKEVGQIVSTDLSADGAAVDVKVFINRPYDRFIYPDTRFWNASGLDVSVSAGGVDIRTAWLAELIAGGLEFDTPASSDRRKPAEGSAAFPLYRDRSSAMRQPEPGARRYVVHFAESVQGLSAGAPVTFLGLPAGEVTNVGLAYDRASGDVRTRVEITLFPERLLKRLSVSQKDAVDEENKRARDALLAHLVEKRGLRAQLRTENLITGQRHVAMDYFPQAPKRRVDWSPEAPPLPTVPSPPAEPAAKLRSILAKVQQGSVPDIRRGLKKAPARLRRQR